MKLPKESKERMKILILIGIGSFASLYGLFQGVSTMIRTKIELGEKLVDTEWQTKAARNDVLSAERSQPRNMETLQRIVEVSERYLLHPILGNYRLGASEILNAYAERTGIEFHAVQEVGIIDLPQPPEKKMINVLKAYTVRVTMECGYYDLIGFVGALERDNPYVVISGLTVIGQSEKDPENHRCVIAIQWPIWSDANMGAIMSERLHLERERMEGAPP